MRVLALQTYDAGSHRAFLAGWSAHSRHEIDVLSLPGRHFKWRMRQAPIAFAKQITERKAEGAGWDALWCTSMLDLAALRGLCPVAAALPAAVYFHENQLAYPTRHTDPRDAHFGMTNMTTALAAIASQRGPRSAIPPCVWWNSAYNRDSFLDALAKLLSRMPDQQPLGAVDAIHQHSTVLYPGIDLVPAAPTGPIDGARVLLWAARWEHDKGPQRFFDALDVLDERRIAFRLSVIGEQFNEQPNCFGRARERFAERIVRWGYQSGREAYRDALREAQVVVSTADHEFFGLAIAEAASAGCLPVLPDALAYPEVWGDSAHYHDQTPEDIAGAIEAAFQAKHNRGARRRAESFGWPTTAPRLDDAIDRLCG